MIKNLLSLCLIVMLLLVSGCGDESDSSQVEADSVTLRVLYSDWPPDMMVYLADKKGFFEVEGLDVELVKDQGLTDAATIRKNEKIDVWAYPLLDFIQEAATGVEKNAQVFMLEDYSEGADGLISYTLTDVKDLKGKKIGAESGTVGEFFLNIVLSDKNIDKTDVEIINIAYDDVIEKIKTGEIDAGVTYEPDLGTAVKDGANVLIDSKTTRRSIVDVFVAKKGDLSSRPEAYRDFVRGVQKAFAFYNENPSEAAEILKDEMGMSELEIIETYKTLNLPNLEANINAFDPLAGHESIYNLARMAMKYLEEQNLIEEQIELEPLFNKEIVNSI